MAASWLMDVNVLLSCWNSSILLLVFGIYQKAD